LLDCVPKNSTVIKLGGGVVGQHDFRMHNIISLRAVMESSVILIFETLPCDICRRRYCGLPFATAFDIDVE
jgi:hypothetical protein